MNEITTKQKCVLIRGGIEIWINEERALVLMEAMQSQKLIEIDGEVVNTFEIIGIYSPQRMEELKRNKQGQWKCKKNVWHDRGEKCTCREILRMEKGIVDGKEIEYPVYK